MNGQGTNDRKRSENITILLDKVEQLLEPCPPSPFRRRRLRKEAEQYLIERVTALPRKAPAKLLISLPETERGNEGNVIDAVHQDFHFRRLEAEKKLRRIRCFGWRSLVVALIFLTVAMLVVQSMRRYLPVGSFLSVIIEGLTVFAWVALWRPGELLLYEWYPFKRDARLFRKLEESEISFITTEESADIARAEGPMDSPKTAKSEISEAEIDMNLAQTFPASDPPSWTLGIDHRAKPELGPPRKSVNDAGAARGSRKPV
jgi:hypothetical protein